MGDPSNVDFAPRRLSKPRTIKSSSNLLSEQPTTPSSPYSAADQDYFARDAVVVNSHGERRSRSKSRSRIRAYLYGSSHDTIQNSSDDEEAQTGIAGAARDVRKRLSRTGSSITLLQSPKASATCLSNSTDSEESAMIADQIKQRAYHDSLAAQNHVSAPVDEDRHVDSVMAPLRRKSLYTPGIATRNASDILRKPPKPSTYNDYYFDHSRPETSPLSYLAALNMSEDGRSTPSDLHYSQLGGILLGTLRVTNGTCSPLPGDRHSEYLAYRSPTPDSKSHDEYYTASEGTVNEGELPTPRSGSPLKFESKSEASSPCTSFHTLREPARLERELSDESFPFERQTNDKSVHCEGEKVKGASSFTMETPQKFGRFERETSAESIRFERQTSTQSLSSKSETPSQSCQFEKETHDENVHSERETDHESFPSKSKLAREYPMEKDSLDVNSAIEKETSQKLIHQKRGTSDFSFERGAANKSCLGRRMPTTSFSSEEKTIADPFRFEDTPPDGASNIADEYIAELGGGPFLNSKAPMSKHGIGNDSLEDEGVVPPRSECLEAQTWRSFINDAEARHAGAGSREDAFRKLTGLNSIPSAQEPQRLYIPFSFPASRHSASMRASIDGSKSHEPLFQHPQRPPDSGYSSNISLSASHETKFIDDTDEARSPDHTNGHQQRRSRCFSGPREMPQYMLAKDDYMSHPLGAAPAPDLSTANPPSAPHHSRRTTTCKFNFEGGSPPVPVHETQASPPPQAGETAKSSRSSSQTPTRKLQKQRPKSQPPLVNVITGYHELTDANIPRVPSIIAARHAGRLRQFPLLEHTFPSSQHTNAERTSSPVQTHSAPIRFPSPANALEAAVTPSRSCPTAPSKHRASTIVVNEDEWGASDLVRSPSWSDFGGGRRKTEQKKLAKEDKGTDKRLLKEEKDLARRLQKDRKDLERQIKKEENKQRSPRSRSASRTRARSSEGQSRHDTLVKIADFGTVTESLGNSPYDIATSMFPNPQNASNWHPHQISTAMPRPKSLCGTINRSQTMLLGMPSVPVLAAVDLKMHNLEWARDRQRSQSFAAVGAESFNDRGGTPGKLGRPHSVMMEEDTPPVPALPSAKQVTQREAAIIRSRPQSMIVEAPVPTPTSAESEQRKAAAYPSEPIKSATRRKTKGSNVVPDLWSNGSLERKSPNTADRSRQVSNKSTRESYEASPAEDNLWETQSDAWSQRRKSAGEALRKNQARDVCDSQEVVNPAPIDEHTDRPASPARASISGAYQIFTPTPSHLGPFPNPLASHPHLTAQQPTYTPNTSSSLRQSATQQTQRPGFSPPISPPRPPVSSQLEKQTPTSTLRRAQTQWFQIPRKRVGSGPPILQTSETAMGSSHYEAVLT